MRFTQPVEGGRPVIKSTVRSCHVRLGTGRGRKYPCLPSLQGVLCRQMSQFRTKRRLSSLIPGQYHILAIVRYVSSLPGCPVWTAKCACCIIPVRIGSLLGTHVRFLHCSLLWSVIVQSPSDTASFLVTELRDLAPLCTACRTAW